MTRNRYRYGKYSRTDHSQPDRVTKAHLTALQLMEKCGPAGALFTLENSTRCADDLCLWGYAEFVQASPFHGAFYRITDTGTVKLRAVAK